jgi:hypothetical protein
MRTITRIAFAGALAVAVATPAAAQRNETFTWNRALAPGKTIEIKGVNGAIKAVAASGSEVRVRAEKSSKKGLVSEVRMEVLETANGVTICAVYPNPRRSVLRRGGSNRPNECTAGEHWNTNTDNNDVEVNWTIEVPRGVLLSANTVNGGIEVEHLTADVSANTVNGDVKVSTTGLAHASTVNGSLDVSMGRNTWNGELEFSTVNGAVTVSFPGDLNAQVKAETVNGDISTDWPLTVRGRFGAKNLNGTIGSGGRTLALSTVNGDIEIRKGSSRDR